MKSKRLAKEQEGKLYPFFEEELKKKIRAATV